MNLNAPNRGRSVGQDLEKPRKGRQMADQVTSLMEQMVSTPDEVAKFLQAQGIKGSRVNPFQCPIARYLLRRIGHRYSVFPPCFWYSPEKGEPAPREPIEKNGRLPQNVRAFLHRFDHGDYPDLFEPEPEAKVPGYL